MNKARNDPGLYRVTSVLIDGTPRTKKFSSWAKTYRFYLDQVSMINMSYVIAVELDEYNGKLITIKDEWYRS